jgi:hypothetical protein
VTQAGCNPRVAAMSVIRLFLVFSLYAIMEMSAPAVGQEVFPITGRMITLPVTINGLLSSQHLEP